MDGISEIKEGEAHWRRLKRLKRLKHMMLSWTDPELYRFSEEDLTESIQGLREKFTKTGRVPQVVDIEDFKLLF